MITRYLFNAEPLKNNVHLWMENKQKKKTLNGNAINSLSQPNEQRGASEPGLQIKSTYVQHRSCGPVLLTYVTLYYAHILLNKTLFNQTTTIKYQQRSA